MSVRSNRESSTMASPRSRVRPYTPTFPRVARLAAGQALRPRASPGSHAGWHAPATRADPIRLLIESSRGRVPELVPVRYARMLQSPLNFFRGALPIMAADLAHTPASGLRAQICGDCHLLNFGGLSTPERRVVFDVNDFDETLPAPWEWDVKRLAASVAVAGLTNGFHKPTRATRPSVASGVIAGTFTTRRARPSSSAGALESTSRMCWA